MRRTIGHHWHASLCGAGLCADCGARFPMDELRKNAEGHFMCDDCGEGRTALEQAMDSAEAAQNVDQRELDVEMAQFDQGVD